MPSSLKPLLVVLAFACNTPPERAVDSTHATSTDQVKPPLEGSKIIGIVFSLVGAGEEVPPNGGVVYLEDAPKEPGEAMAATVNVDHKSFSPPITVISTGGMVTFGNTDPLPHHVFSPDLQNWDTGILKKGETRARRFDTPGPVSLLCNIHPEMLGYVLVIPSSSYGRIGTDGRYVIPNVHAGTYRATAWSPRLPPTTQSVTIGASGAVTANFTLRPP
jgi:plastocyanin